MSFYSSEIAQVYTHDFTGKCCNNINNKTPIAVFTGGLDLHSEESQISLTYSHADTNAVMWLAIILLL